MHEIGGELKLPCSVGEDGSKFRWVLAAKCSMQEVPKRLGQFREEG